MKYFIEGKEDIVNLVSSQLKAMGVKVPKIKKSKVTIPKQQGKKPFQSKLKVFGVHLDAQDVASNYSHLPKFILSCTDYLKKYSKEVGLFRKAGSIARQKNLRVKIENGGSFEGSEPNDVAALMKQWLRELPEPLIPNYLHETFIRCQNLNDTESCIMSTLLVCLFLPPNHLYTLKHLMAFLAEIATDAKRNRMDVENLALMMAPNIFAIGTNVNDKSCIKVHQFRSIIELLIENADKIGELPPLLSSKLATLEKSELNSPNDIESSPGLSRKNYLLRSIKKFVKQNSTPPPTLQTPSPDISNILSQRLLPTENNCMEIKGTVTGTKEKGSLFATRSSEDICKRSFGLLRKKEKKRLKVSSGCSSITQSLGIESSMNFPIHMDKENLDSIIQEPLFEKELNVGCILEVNQFDKKETKLEDIEMTTFKTHVIDQEENLQVFPIPSFSSNICQAQPKFLFQHLETEKTDPIQEVNSILSNEVKSSNLLIHVDMQKLVDATSSTCNLDKVLKDNKDSYCSKTPKRVQISCSPKTLQLFTRECENSMETDITPINNICSSRTTDLISGDRTECSTVMSERENNTEIYYLSNADSNLQSIDTELSVKGSSMENVGFVQMIREATFIIEPKKTGSLIDEVKLLGQKQMSKTVSNYECITSDIRNNPVHKKQCKALNSKNKRTTHSIQSGKVIKKSNNSAKANCTKNKPLSKESVLKKVKTNSIHSNSNKEETKLFRNQASLYLDSENFSLCASKENKRNNHSMSPCIQQSDKFSSSFETTRRPKRKSTSMCPTTPSGTSESKIPRLRNSSENYRGNSSEAATSHIQKVPKATSIKEADSCAFPTRIPVKYDSGKSNLSTLQLSINDSCFLTPNRNALLSPNSIVWMSGNKYFVSSSPEEELINKRESIAMILESNAGHVQAKVHLYDDLIRESEYSTDSVPCHSTPTSKFNKRLSSSSQSLKIPSQHRTKLQSSNSISYSKRTLVDKSNTAQSGEKSQKLTPCSPKFSTHSSLVTPIKGHLLKDVTNKGFPLNAPKNCKNIPIKKDMVWVFPDKNAIEIRKKQKRNSFSGNTSQKLPKRVSRSESTPGPRPHRRVSCLIQEANCTK